jgi:Bacterial SH3 domain
LSIAKERQVQNIAKSKSTYEEIALNDVLIALALLTFNDPALGLRYNREKIFGRNKRMKRFYGFLMLLILLAAQFTQAQSECPITSITINNDDANALVSGEVLGTGCEVFLEITNERPYWVNLQIITSQDVVITPDGEFSSSLWSYQVLHPNGTMRFRVQFNAPNQYVIASVNYVSAESDNTAYTMNNIQSVVDALSLLNVISADAESLYKAIVEYYPTLKNAIDASPHMDAAFTALGRGNLYQFTVEMLTAFDSGELSLFANALSEIGIDIAIDTLEDIIENWGIGRIFNTLRIIGTKYWVLYILVFGETSGFVEFRVEGLVITDLNDNSSSTQACIIVNIASVNLRSGPGVAFPVVGAAQQGDEFPVIAQAREEPDGVRSWYWIIRPGGRFAWIAAWIVDLCPGISEIPIAADTSVVNTGPVFGGQSSQPTSCLSSRVFTMTITNNNSDRTHDYYIDGRLVATIAPNQRVSIQVQGGWRSSQICRPDDTSYCGKHTTICVQGDITYIRWPGGSSEGVYPLYIP